MFYTILPAARTERQRLLYKYGRRLCGAILRASVRQVSKTDDWVNFWNLLLAPRTSRAVCPICNYAGPFLQHARQPREICPQCQARARHRVIYLALQQWQSTWNSNGGQVLHIAPETPLIRTFSTSIHQYITGDIEPGKADITLDLRNLALASSTFHLILASHVLEHIVEDRVALNEVYRVLQSGGVAVLIVPIVAEKTVEWGYQDPQRNGHARDCGLDYFERYREVGFKVDLVQTDDFAEPERYALASWRNGQRTIHWVAFCTKL